LLVLVISAGTYTDLTFCRSLEYYQRRYSGPNKAVEAAIVNQRPSSAGCQQSALEISPLELSKIAERHGFLSWWTTRLRTFETQRRAPLSRTH
jgi:hypothetical protein